MWPFKKRAEPEVETRSSGNFTQMVMDWRAANLAGSDGVAQLSAAVQSSVSHWENAMAVCDVTGTDLLDPMTLAIIGRDLGLKGESVWYVGPDKLLAVSDYEVSTSVGGQPRGYRISLPSVGGGTTQVALSAEILHFRIGCSAAEPWQGTSPLRRSSLSADLLAAVESSLSEVYQNAALGSSIVPFPESSETDREKIASAYRGLRGKLVLTESMAVHAAGGPQPQTDWRANSLTPDIQSALPIESLESARDQIFLAYGIPPALIERNSTGQMLREIGRHLATWTLTPICKMVAHEASQKLATEITLDCQTPLQSFDAGGRSRAAKAVVELLALAKQEGVDAETALKVVGWDF
ncbi:MAG: phage portal protein [Halioglobus sp.]